MLTLGFVKVTRGYVKKAEPIFMTLPFKYTLVYSETVKLKEISDILLTAT